MKFSSYKRFYKFAMASELAVILRDFSKDPSLTAARFVSKRAVIPIESQGQCSGGVCTPGSWKPKRPNQ
jgi:hypothetical protein